MYSSGVEANNTRIVHCDINSYFAILLQQKYPRLRGKPVGVVKEKGRTCIIAASKEAKVRGVKTGCRLWEAKKLCPDIIPVPAEFDYYLDGTRRLHALFTQLVPKVEIFSLDEAFLHLTDCSFLFPDAHAFGRMVQSRVKDTLGEVVTCNVGISWNRFLAKMASETAVKGTIAQITKDNLNDYLVNTSFGDVCGIGFRLEPRLKMLGINNLYLLNFVTDDFLVEHFGKFYAKELRKMGQGEEPHFLTLIDHNPHMKSVGRSITGWDLCDSEADIKRVLYNLTAEVCAKVRKMGLIGRYAAVYLYGEDQGWGKHITLRHYTNHTDEVFNYLYHWLYKRWRRSFRIIKFATCLGMLTPEKNTTPQLLPEWHRKGYMYKAIDKINRRFGEYTVYPAVMHSNKIIKEEVTGFLGDKDYQFNYR